MAATTIMNNNRCNLRMLPKVRLVVKLTDGTEQRFEFESEPGTEFSVGTRIDKLLHQTSIAFALDDRLVIIPTHQIKTIEISPISLSLPGNVITHAKRIA